MKPSFFIKTFGCQQNWADSERIASYYLARGFKETKDLKSATVIIINTCMVRQSAEDKVTGFIKNIAKRNPRTRSPLGQRPKIILTGCMTGMVARDTSGKYLKTLRKRIPEVDEFLPPEEVGFDYPALRNNITHAWIPISNGCNNFCTYCVVPFTRGREISRPFKDIIDEIEALVKKGCQEVTLLGQNVNSYGSDLVKNTKACYKLPSGRVVKPVMVKHLGKLRIPTLFPYLLEEVCKIEACPSKSSSSNLSDLGIEDLTRRSGGITTVKFISSNPWDFSDELIEVIAKNPKTDRNIHLPAQSGDDQILKKMNRWYTRAQYINLVNKIKKEILNVQISTDIIVGFCGETEKQFQNTVKLARSINFAYAYIAKYSPRPNTAAAKAFVDDVPYAEKEKRFHILDQLINHKGNPRTAVH